MCSWQARFSAAPRSRPPPQLTGSAALLARMRRSRAVSGQEAPAAAAPAPAGATTAAAELLLLHGGEAASQVASDLADQARAHGLAARLVPMDKFKAEQLERRVRARTLRPPQAP